MEPDTYRLMAEIQALHWWYEGRRSILRSILQRLRLSPGSLILEAGCGPGANLKMLSEFGLVSAFDPDDFAVQHANFLTGVAVEKGLLPDGIPFAGPFDLIGAFDVIEHVEEDLASLQRLHALLKPEGRAIFTVPAFKFLWSRHDEMNHHKRRYTLPQFQKLLKEAGYKVEFISYYNTFLFPLIFTIRMIKNILRIEEPDEKMPSPFINNILCRIFSWEHHLLKYSPLPVGVSIIAVCKA